MSELKACAHCGHEAQPIRYEYKNGEIQDLAYCPNDDCPMHHRTLSIEAWQTRPIEDALNARIAELETEKECEMRVFKDGNAWCFVLPDFQDLQVSSSVWMKEGVLDKIYKELRSVRNES